MSLSKYWDGNIEKVSWVYQKFTFSTSGTSKSWLPMIHSIPYPYGIASKQIERHKCKPDLLVRTEGMYTCNHPPSNCNNGLPDKSRESYPKDQLPLDSGGLILKNSSAIKIATGLTLLLSLRSKPFRVVDIHHNSHKLALNVNPFPTTIPSPIHLSRKLTWKWKYPRHLTDT